MDWCDESLYLQMKNWTRWACGSISKGVACRSLESYFKPPQHWEARSPSASVDILAAEKIEKIIRTLELKKRTLLKHHYIKRSDPKHVCRRLRMSMKSYEIEMFEAHRKISLAFFV